VLGSESLVLEGLTEDDRAALAWVAEELPAGGDFLVVPDTPIWEVSKLAEWFPALTGRTSVSTVQGSEWVGDDGFELARAVHPYAYRCGGQSTECLEELATTHDVAFSYVYIRQVGSLPCCGLLVESLDEDPAFELLYDGPGALIYGRTAGDEGPATLKQPSAADPEIP
jgi:hypothetical protein